MLGDDGSESVGLSERSAAAVRAKHAMSDGGCCFSTQMTPSLLLSDPPRHSACLNVATFDSTVVPRHSQPHFEVVSVSVA